MRVQQYIWLAVTADKYEHPIAVADTAEELSKMLGVTRTSVITNALRQESGKISGRRIIKVRREE